MANYLKFQNGLLFLIILTFFYSCNNEQIKEKANEEIRVLTEITHLNQERMEIISENIISGQNLCLHYRKGTKYDDAFAQKIKTIYTNNGVIDQNSYSEEYSVMFNELVGFIYKDSIFQDKYLFDMKNAFGEGRISGQCYAELADIVYSSRYNEQLYGTLFGYYSPIIIDSINLDVRREKINLGKYEIAKNTHFFISSISCNSG